MKKILYKSYISNRTLPVNLIDSEKWLFERELTRTIHDGYVRLLNNVVCFNLGIYKFKGLFQYNKYTNFSKKKFINKLRDFKKYKLYQNDVIKIKSGIWILDNKSQIYGHFLNDAMCRLIMIPDSIKQSYKILLPKILEINWIIEFLDFFEIKYEIIDDQKKYLVKNLYTTNYAALPGNFNEKVLIKLQKEALKRNSNVSLASTKTYLQLERVWIDRSKSRRGVENSEALIPILKKYKFKIIALEDLSISEKISLLQNIKILAGSHGSGLANMIFMKPNSSILDVRDPSDKYKNAFFSQASALNLKYYYIEREVSHQIQNPLFDNIVIDPQKLDTVLDLMTNQLS